MITYDEELKIFSSSIINDNKIFSGFGTKAQGDGRHHIENIYRFFDEANIKYKKIVIPEQIHSVNTAFFNSTNQEKLEKIDDTDGVLTGEPGVVLTVVTADCLPVIYVDKKAGIIGISHQGWRGSVKRMPQKMVGEMLKKGCRNDTIKVAIGPTIGECCYDVPEDRYYEFKEEFDGYSDKIFHFRAGKIHLNLTLLNYLLLKEAGIPEKNIEHFPFCTKCDREHFFSYRRDKKSDYGEMFSFVLML